LGIGKPDNLVAGAARKLPCSVALRRDATWRLHSVDNRIEKRIELKTPVSRVWRALTDYRQFGE